MKRIIVAIMAIAIALPVLSNIAWGATATKAESVNKGDIKARRVIKAKPRAVTGTVADICADRPALNVKVFVGGRLVKEMRLAYFDNALVDGVPMDRARTIMDNFIRDNSIPTIGVNLRTEIKLEYSFGSQYGERFFFLNPHGGDAFAKDLGDPAKLKYTTGDVRETRIMGLRFMDTACRDEIRDYIFPVMNGKMLHQAHPVR